MSYCLQRPAEPFGNAATHNPGFINVGEEIGFLSEQGNGLTIRATPQMCTWASITVIAVSSRANFHCLTLLAEASTKNSGRGKVLGNRDAVKSGMLVDHQACRQAGQDQGNE